MAEPGETIYLPYSYVGAQPEIGLDTLGGGFSYNAPPEGMADIYQQ